MLSREQLIESAGRTLNARPRATLADIAREAGISRATLHRHVENRDDLMQQLGEHSLRLWDDSLTEARADEAATSEDPAVVRAAVEALVRSYVRSVELFGFTLTDPFFEDAPGLVEQGEELEGREQALLARAQELGLLRRDVPVAWLSSWIFGLLVAARDATRRGQVGLRAVESLVLTSFVEGRSAP